MVSGRDWPRGRCARVGRDRLARMVAGRSSPRSANKPPRRLGPNPGGMEAAARQAAQAGPQEPAPQPQGQLQLLALGQDQELPEDQDLGDHDPGAVEQDDALESR